MKHIITLFLFLFCYVESSAQFCKKTSIFFDSDKSKLTGESNKRLDSLLDVAGDDEYLIEMYGMTDSVGNGDHNQKLAEQRMLSAERYLKSGTKGSLTFKKKNLIESNVKISNSQDANLAYNRRVDIYLIPTANGKIQMAGNNGLSAEYPIDFFEPCGVCNSDPSLKLYTDNAEASAAGITFQSTTGDSLTTAGSVVLRTNPCSGDNSDSLEVTYRICGGTPDTGMTVWEADTIQGKVYWKETKIPLEIDPVTGCYVFKAKGRKVRNADKLKCRGSRNKPDTLYRIVLPPGRSYGNIYITDESGRVRYPARPDSIDFSPDDTMLYVRMFVQQGNEYYFRTIRIQEAMSVYRQDRTNVTRLYRPEMQSFSLLFASDTSQLIKCGKPHKGKFGYYLPEYNMFIPIDSVTGKYYAGEIPAIEYQYAYLRGKKLYASDDISGKGKYATRKHSWKLRIRKKSLGKFEQVKDFFTPKGRKKK